MVMDIGYEGTSMAIQYDVVRFLQLCLGSRAAVAGIPWLTGASDGMNDTRRGLD
jgi:hypothetical protein